MSPMSFQRKTWGWVLLAAVICLTLGGGAWGWFNNQTDTATIGPDLGLTRVVMNGQKTTAAYASIPYLRDSTDYTYLNVAIDLNHDGKIAAYTASGATQEEWVVRNLPSRVLTAEGAHADFRLSDLAVDSQQNFPVAVVLTTDSLTDWRGKSIPYSAFQKTIVASITQDEISTRAQLDPNKLGSTGTTEGTTTSATDFTPPPAPPTSSATDTTGSTGGNQGTGQPVKDKTVSTLAKEFNVFHSGVPDMDQKHNECVPTSTANSLRWLAKENKFTDKLPISNTELLGELKDDMKWVKEGGVVVDQDFLSGKNSFVTAHALPITTHEVGSKPFDVNIVAKIALELQKGQDVEIDLEYGKFKDDGSYERVGGHMVTVVGAEGTRDGQYLDIHDPLSPGPDTLDRYKVNGSHLIDYRYEGDYVTYIRYAFAESPSVPPSEPPADSTVPPDGSTIVPNLTEVIGHFITLGQDNGNGELSITITPTKTYEKEITKLEFSLIEFKEMPTSAKLILNGGGTNDWNCVLNGTTYSCSGTTPLQENTDSVINLFLDKPLSFCPPTIETTVFVSNEAVTTVQLEKK